MKGRAFILGGILAVLGSVMFAAEAVAAPQRVSATIEGSQVVVSVEGQIFTAYKFDPSLKKPYFYPMAGPVSKKSVTVESTEPYPHHNSLFFGCDKVNGGNYWQDTNERGQIISQGPRILEKSGERVVFTDESLWKQPGKNPVIRDKRRVTVTAPSKSLRFLDFTITLEALTDIRIEKTNHSLFSARMTPALSVKEGGTLINAKGDQSEKGTLGEPSPWCDYFGTRNGVTEGLAIFQHPDNKWFPSKWFTRDYGFFSPTPMYWLEDGYFALPKGETLTLCYRVVVHAGTTEGADIANLFAGYAKEKARQ